MQLIIPDIHSAGCIFRVFRVIIEITIPINENNGPKNITSIQVYCCFHDCLHLSFRPLELKLSQQLAWPFPVILAFIDFFILGVLIPNFILIASVVSKNAPATKYMIKFIKNIRHQSLINPTFTLCNQHSRDSIKCFRISNSWCNPSVHTGPTV